MAKKEKTTRFSIQGFDLAHYKTTEQYVAMIDALFNRATQAITNAAARGKYDPSKPFSFDDHPTVKAEMQKAVGQLASQLTTTIEKGSRNQWLFACKKNDGFINSIMDTSKLKKSTLKKMQDRNLDALEAFQQRKIGGMNLSERVWKYMNQYKTQIEDAIDMGLGDGRSAQALARDVKQYLREPDKRFRRVKIGTDADGNPIYRLSKRAAAYHPGQGVYRSSVKNAQRLTRSEINMAYRESDYLRWQQLDFVVGFEIHRSNHEPLCKCKLCDRLKGRYPKTFKFKGWHPQCMCFAVPILMDEETFREDRVDELRSALRGTEYKKHQAKNAVVDVPDEFKAWVEENLEAAENWGNVPYFVKDNFVDGSLKKGLKIDLPEATKPRIDPVEEQLNLLMPMVQDARRIAIKWGLANETADLSDAVLEKKIDQIQKIIATIKKKTDELETSWTKFLSDVDGVVNLANTNGINISKMTEYTDLKTSIEEINGNKSLWKDFRSAYEWGLGIFKKAVEDKIAAKELKESKANDDVKAMSGWYKRTEEATTISKTEDDKEVEFKLGITKGVAMTFDESNELRGNPNYEKEYIECPQSESTHYRKNPDGTKIHLKKNPLYKKKFTINCQSCVVAHELRRRGFDVQAIGNTPNSIPRTLSYHTELAWLDEDGNTPKSKVVNWMWSADKSAMSNSIVANLDAATSETGRYHIKWQWNGQNSGHIITCERLSNGLLRIYDPQNGKIITNFGEYALDFKHSNGIKVLRVDNLRINPLYAGCLKGNKPKKSKKPKKK